jgi:hypothetical protein
MLQPYSAPIGKEKKHVVCDVNSPHSNTGLLKPEINIRPDNLWCVGKRDHRPDLKVLTGEESCFSSPKKWAELTKRLVLLFSRCFIGFGVSFSTIPEKGKNYYDKGFYLRRGGKELASICYDGKNQKGTFLIILSGKFCSLLDLRQWRLIYTLLRRFDLTLTRFDLALDDYSGKVFDHKKIESLAHRKPELFKAIGKPQGHNPRCWRVEGEDGSFSVYIGSAKSTVLCCVYEKGKESKDTQRARDYPFWIRYEIRFRAKSSILDLEMILPENWGPAAAGSSVYLTSKIKTLGAKFTMLKVKAKESVLDGFVSSYMAAEKQWGVFNDWCCKLGLEVPRRPSGYDSSPYNGLTIYDLPEILKRIDSARTGGLRSSALSAESEIDDSGLF